MGRIRLPSPPSSSTSAPRFHVRATRRVFVSLSNTALNKPHRSTFIHSLGPSITPLMAVTTTSHTQIRTHGGHSHNHDNSYLTSTNKSDAGVRITRIGLFVNLGMAIGKGLGGYYFHSQGMYGSNAFFEWPSAPNQADTDIMKPYLQMQCTALRISLATL
jgi:hypothetical protein